MPLLEFTRGPGMACAITTFVAVTGWRLIGIALPRGYRDLSEPLSKTAWKGLRLIKRRTRPRRDSAHTGARWRRCSRA
jgi:hypothetical protein